MAFNIVKIEEKNLKLSSSLEISAFGRTQMTSMMKETGFIAEVKNDDLTITPYKFNETEVIDGKTYFVGDAFKGKLLSDILNEKNNEEKSKNIGLFIKIIDLIYKDSENFETKHEISSICSGGGIIISCETGCEKILFLPPELFEQCASNIASVNSPEYANLFGKFVYKGLNFKDSLLFLKSVVLYKTISGVFPFKENDLSKRQTDIYDCNFIPLNLQINGIDEKTADSIEAGLKIQPEEKFTNNRRNFKNKKLEKKRELMIKTAESFSQTDFFAEISDENRTKKYETAQFIKLKKDYIRKKTAEVSTKRFFRRNCKTILAGAAIFIFGIYGIYSFQKSNANLATSKGLDSTKTVQAAYTFISNADVPNLQEIAKGKKIRNLITTISGFYVTNTQRLSFDQENGTTNPAQWFFFKKESKYWLFGITNLKIDGNSFSANCQIQRRKDKPQKITTENEVSLKKNDEVTHEVQYFLIHTDTLRINIEKHNETVTLKWDGNKWILRQITGKNKSKFLKLKDFKEEYHALLSANNNDIEKTISELRGKYEWLPSDEDLTDGAKVMLEKYDSKLALEFLEKHETNK